MKTAVKIFCVLMVGIVIGSTLSHQIVEEAEGQEPTFWEIILWLMNWFMGEHNGDSTAHPGRGGLHVIDGNGEDRGPYLHNVLSSSGNVLYEPSSGVFYVFDWWTGETRPVYSPVTKLYFESVDCSGTGYPAYVTKPTDSFLFPTDSSGTVYRIAAFETRTIRSSLRVYEDDPPECAPEDVPEERGVGTAWIPVSIPGDLPLPLRLEIR